MVICVLIVVFFGNNPVGWFFLFKSFAASHSCTPQVQRCHKSAAVRWVEDMHLNEEVVQEPSAFSCTDLLEKTFLWKRGPQRQRSPTGIQSYLVRTTVCVRSTGWGCVRSITSCDEAMICRSRCDWLHRQSSFGLPEQPLQESSGVFIHLIPHAHAHA